jgi:hypothetical protein
MSINNHEEFENYIEKTYNFKEKWKDQCSKYNIGYLPSSLPAVRRIIVIGDIHGDWEMAQQLLKVGKVIDDDGNWIGDDTIVVQVGDQIDRCRPTINSYCHAPGVTNPDEDSDWKILQYFTELHKLAKSAGGAVYSLIGNHELMNVNGDFRYVSYKGITDFHNYKNPYNTVNNYNNLEEDDTISVSSENKTFSDGILKEKSSIKLFFEHKTFSDNKFKNNTELRKWAFKPGNPISDFLACTRQMAIIIGSNLFVHAGVLPEIAKKYSVSNLNQLMSLYLWNKLESIESYDEVFKSSDISPLWNRVFGNFGMQQYSNLNQYINLDDAALKCSQLLNPLKEIYGVGNIYVGHTPLMDHGISSVCDGKVWLTDFGASKAFDKFDTKLPQRSDIRKAQVLEILYDGDLSKGGGINILK